MESGFVARLAKDNVLAFERNHIPVLWYRGLRAWDAHARTLPAHMELHGDELRLTVHDSGAVYPVTIDPWMQQPELTASDAMPGDFFGVSVAVSGDTAIVGAQGKANQTGAAYIYVRSPTGWTQQAILTAPDRTPGDLFGWSVALSGDTALVGAYLHAGNRGAVYVFARVGTSWKQQARLTADGGAPGDQLGSSVALYGNTALIGAWGGAGGKGTAYIFVRRGTTWTHDCQFMAPDAAVGDYFGMSVALSADTAIVGAGGHNGNQGAAYVYVLRDAAWYFQARLAAADGAPNDNFGTVALSGDTAIIGAYWKAGYRGAAYVFARTGSRWIQRAELSLPSQARLTTSVVNPSH